MPPGQAASRLLFLAEDLHQDADDQADGDPRHNPADKPHLVSPVLTNACAEYKGSGRDALQEATPFFQAGAAAGAWSFFSGCNSVMQNMLQNDTAAVAKNIAL